MNMRHIKRFFATLLAILLIFQYVPVSLAVNFGSTGATLVYALTFLDPVTGATRMYYVEAGKTISTATDAADVGISTSDLLPSGSNPVFKISPGYQAPSSNTSCWVGPNGTYRPDRFASSYYPPGNIAVNSDMTFTLALPPVTTGTGSGTVQYYVRLDDEWTPTATGTFTLLRESYSTFVGLTGRYYYAIDNPPRLTYFGIEDKGLTYRTSAFTKTVTTGTALALATAPISAYKQGFLWPESVTFDGYYASATSLSGGLSLTNDTLHVRPTSNYDFCTVKFCYKIGDKAAQLYKQEIMPVGKKLTLSDQYYPAVAGFKLGGWTNASGSTVSGIQTTGNGNKVFTALLVPDKYAVTYLDYTGKALTTDAYTNHKSVTPDSEIVLPGGPVRDNYDFTGWKLGASTYGAGERHKVIGNTAFQATYVQKFPVDFKTILGESYAGYPQYGSTVTSVAGPVAPDEITQGGAKGTFKGWTCDGRTILTENQLTVKNITGPLTYTAVYEFSVALKDSNGMDFDTPQTATVNTLTGTILPNEKDYPYAWYASRDNKDHQLVRETKIPQVPTYYAYHEYSVTYIDELFGVDQSTLAYGTDNPAEAPESKRPVGDTRYTGFLGWYDKDGNIFDASPSQRMPSADTYWAVYGYDVDLYDYDGITPVKTATGQTNKAFAPPAADTRPEGCAFAGWYAPSVTSIADTSAQNKLGTEKDPVHRAYKAVYTYEMEFLDWKGDPIGEKVRGDTLTKPAAPAVTYAGDEALASAQFTKFLGFGGENGYYHAEAGDKGYFLPASWRYQEDYAYTLALQDFDTNPLDTVTGSTLGGIAVPDASRTDADGNAIAKFLGWYNLDTPSSSPSYLADELDDPDFFGIPDGRSYQAVYSYVIRFLDSDGVSELIVLDGRNGSALPNTLTSFDIPSNLAIEGATFLGWYAGETPLTEANKQDYTSDTSFIAAYDCTVSFADWDGTSLWDGSDDSAYRSQRISTLDKNKQLTVPTPPLGAIGWHDGNQWLDYTGARQPGGTVITMSTTFKAVYEYTVEFYLDNKIDYWPDADAFRVNGNTAQGFTFPAAPTHSDAIATEVKGDGKYEFVGWHTFSFDATAQNDVLVSNYLAIHTDTKLYARFAKLANALVFFHNPDGNVISQVAVNIGKALAPSDIPAMANTATRRFRGWTEDRAMTDYSGTGLFDTGSAFASAVVVHLYPVYGALVYDILFTGAKPQDLYQEKVGTGITAPALPEDTQNALAPLGWTTRKGTGTVSYLNYMNNTYAVNLLAGSVYTVTPVDMTFYPLYRERNAVFNMSDGSHYGTFKAGVIEAPDPSALTGYDFVCYARMPDVTYLAFNQTLADVGITRAETYEDGGVYSAVYRRQTVRVNFFELKSDIADGTGPITSIDYPYGAALGTPVVSGYSLGTVDTSDPMNLRVFNGWLPAEQGQSLGRLTGTKNADGVWVVDVYANYITADLTNDAHIIVFLGADGEPMDVMFDGLKKKQSYQLVPSGSKTIEPEIPTDLGTNVAFLAWAKPDGEAFTFGNAIDENLLLTAKFKPYYVVSFFVDGQVTASVELNEAERKNGFRGQIPPVTSVERNTSFNAWYLADKDGNFVDENGTAISNIAGVEPFTDFDSEVTRDLYLRAAFYHSYYITYDTQGGSIFRPTRVFESADARTLIPDEPDEVPTRPGYRFAGWYLDEECAKPADAIFGNPLSYDLTLYARWAPEVVDVQVVYWMQKDKQSRPPVNQYDGTCYNAVKVETFKAATESGITLLGTTLMSGQTPAKELSTAGMANAKYFALVPGATGTVKVKGTGTVVNVYYNRNLYTLKFDPTSSGTMTDSDGTMTYTSANPYVIQAELGEYIAERWPYAGNPNFQFQASRNSFQGWKGYGDGTQVSMILYMAELGCDLTGKTLTGVWGSVKPYFLMYMFDLLRDDTVQHTRNGVDYAISTDYTQVAYASGYFNNKDIAGMTEQGHVGAWPGENANLPSIVAEARKITGIQPEMLFYIRKTYDVTVDLNDLTAVDGQQLSAELTSTAVPYGTAYFYKPETGAAQSTSYTLNAKVKYGEKMQYFRPQTPERADCEFLGWYREAECLNEFDFNGTMPLQNVRIFAKWRVSPVNATFYLDDERTEVHQETGDIDRNSTVDPPDPQSDTTHGQFMGWYFRPFPEKFPDFTQAFIDGVTPVTQKDTAIFAVWKNKDFSVSYATADEAAVRPNGSSYELMQPVVLDQMNDTNGKLVFVGWSVARLKRDGSYVSLPNSPIYQPGEPYNVYFDTVFVGQWREAAQTIKVVYHSNEDGAFDQGTGRTSRPFFYLPAQSVPAASGVFEHSTPGYAFDRWAYEDRSPVADGLIDTHGLEPNTENDTVHVYAIWVAAQVKHKVKKLWVGDNGTTLRPNTLTVWLNGVSSAAPVMGGNEWLYEITTDPGTELSLTETFPAGMDYDGVYLSEGGYDPDAKIYVLTNTLTRPSLKILKFADIGADEADALAKDGKKDVIPYRIEIENNGDVLIRDVRVSDSLAGKAQSLAASSTLARDAGIETTEGAWRVGDIAVGEKVTITYDYPVAQADVDAQGIDNTVTVTSENPHSTKPADKDRRSWTPATARVIPWRHPDYTVEKTAEFMRNIYTGGAETTGGKDFKEGDVIRYTIAVTNTGNMTLRDVSVVDSMQAGENVTSTYGGVVRTDAVDPFTLETLERDKVFAVSYDYLVTAADVAAGTIENAVTVSAREAKPNSEPIGEGADKNVSVDNAPALKVDKMLARNTTNPARDNQVETGDVLEYRVTVQNTGNVTLTDLLVTDTLIGTAGYLTGSATAVNPDGCGFGTDTAENGFWTLSRLLPGESADITYAYTVQQSDIDKNAKVVNLATASAQDPKGGTVNGKPESEGADSVALDTKYDPAFTIEKNLYGYVRGTGGVAQFADDAARLEYRAQERDVLLYEVTVRNTGNVTLDGLTITDNMLGDGQAALVTLTGGGASAGAAGKDDTLSLAPGSEPGSVYFAYTVTLEDIDGQTLRNTATASWTDPLGLTGEEDGHQTDATSDSCEVTAEQAPALHIGQTVTVLDAAGNPKGKPADAGDILEITMRIENTGNMTLTDIVFEDTFRAFFDQPGLLGDASGLEGFTLTNNTAWAELAAKYLTLISGEIPADLTLAPANYPDGSGRTGETSAFVLTYRYTVQQGDVDSGEDLVNTVSAQGKVPPAWQDNSGTDTIPTGEVSATGKILRDPAVMIKKECLEIIPNNEISDHEIAQQDDTAVYQLTFTNTGNTTLRSIALFDTITAAKGSWAFIPAGETAGKIIPATGDVTMTEGAGSIWHIENQPIERGQSVTAIYTYTVAKEDAISVPDAESPSGYADKLVNQASIRGACTLYDDPAGSGSAGKKADSDWTSKVTLPTGFTPSIVVTKTALVTRGGQTVGEYYDDIATLGDLTSSAAKAIEGDIATYIIFVENVGDVSIEDIVLTDPGLTWSGVQEITARGTGDGAAQRDGDKLTLDVLKPGETFTVSYKYLIRTEDVVRQDLLLRNTLALDAKEDRDGDAFSLDKVMTVDIPLDCDPKVAIVKSGQGTAVSRDDGKLSAGDTVTYQVTVTNEGNVTLREIAVGDSLIGKLGDTPVTVVFTPASEGVLTEMQEAGETPAHWVIPALAPGQQAVITYQYTVRQSDIDLGVMRNTASIVGCPDPRGLPDGVRKGDPSMEDLAVDFAPELTMSKSIVERVKARPGAFGDTEKIEEGDTVIFRVDATNTGTATLDGLVISEVNADTYLCVKQGDVWIPVGQPGAYQTEKELTLSPGESAAVYFAYVVKRGDVVKTQNGKYQITNTVHANWADDDRIPNQHTDPDADQSIVNQPASVTEETHMLNPHLTTRKKAYLQAGNGPEVGPNDRVRVGDVIGYVVTLENDGDVTLEGFEVRDPMFAGASGGVSLAIGDVDAECTLLAPGVYKIARLGFGKTLTIAYNYQVLQEDIDNGGISNTVTAAYADPRTGAEVVDPDDEDGTDTHVEYLPGMTVQKTAHVTRGGERIELKNALADALIADEEITYTLRLTNTGNVTLYTEDLAVVDAMLPAAVCTNGALDFAKYDSGLARIGVDTANHPFIDIVYTHTVTQADVDAGRIANTYSAGWTSPVEKYRDTDSIAPDGGTVTARTRYAPALAIEKAAVILGGKTQADAGDVIEYTLTITNTGNVTLSDVTLSDELKGTIDISKDADADELQEMGITANTGDWANIALAPGETRTFAYSYQVSQEDVDTVAEAIGNKATAAGKTPMARELDGNDPATDIMAMDGEHPYTQTETRVLHTPGMTIGKTGQVTTANENRQNGDTASAAEGDVITYTAVITNTGNVQLKDIILTDVMLAGVAGGHGAVELSEASKALVDIQDGSWKLKAPIPRYADASHTVRGSVTLTYTYRVTKDDTISVDPQGKLVGSIDNTLTGAGRMAFEAEGGAPSVTAESGFRIPVDYRPDLAVEKEIIGIARPSEGGAEVTGAAKEGIPRGIPLWRPIVPISSAVKENDVITYQITVTNTGTVTLENIILTDGHIDRAVAGSVSSTRPGALTKMDNQWTIEALGVGESVVVQYAYAVTAADALSGSIQNSATATRDGVRPEEETASADDGVTTETQMNPNVKITKTADKTSGIKAGDTVTYTVLVENTGDITLTNLAVSDAMFGVSSRYGGTKTIMSVDGFGTIPVLAPSGYPGNSYSVTYTYMVTQADMDDAVILNTANVVCDNPGYGKPPAQGGEADTREKLTETASETVHLDFRPAYTLVKSPYAVKDAQGTRVFGKDIAPDAYKAKEGDEITFKVTVTNTGSVTLSGIQVTEERADVRWRDAAEGVKTQTAPVGTLAPANAEGLGGGSEDVYFVYTVTHQDVTQSHGESYEIWNSVSALWKDDGRSDESEAEVSPENEAEGNSITPLPVDYAPGMALEKTAWLGKLRLGIPGAPKVGVGDTVTYQIALRNTGNVTLADIAIADPMFSDADAIRFAYSSSGDAPAADPAPDISGGLVIPQLTYGQTLTIAYDYTITQANVDAGGVTNTATASAKDPRGGEQNVAPTGGDANADIETLNDPGMSAVKTADIKAGAKLNDVITYTVEVTNEGNVALENILVTDGLMGVTLGETQVDGVERVDDQTGRILSLAVGETKAVVFTYTVTQVDVEKGRIENRAIVTGKSTASDPNEPTDPAPAAATPTETVLTLDNPELTVEKTTDQAGEVDIGDVITYTVTVENTGNVTIENIVVIDTLKGITLTDGDWNIGKLKPGKKASLTYTYTVTPEDVKKGEVFNRATASGKGTGGKNDPKDASGETRTPAEYEPSMTIQKTTRQKDGEAGLGDKITYSVTVANTGNVELKDVIVTDALKNISPPSRTIPSLPVRESKTVAFTYEVTQEDIDAGQIANVATAKWKSPFGGAFDLEETTDEVTVKPLIRPAMTLSKSVTSGRTAGLKAGDAVTFEVVVKNTGNVTLKNIALEDTMKARATLLDGTAWEADEIAPSKKWVVRYQIVITQADVDRGGVQNMAFATADSAAGDPPGDQEDGITLTTEYKPGLTVGKTLVSAPEPAAIGDTLGYRVTVRNTGTLTVSGITVTDSLLPGWRETISSLAPGESRVYEYTHTVTDGDAAGGRIVNTASASGTLPATGENPDGPPIEGKGTHTLPVYARLTIHYNYNGAAGDTTETKTYYLPFGREYGYDSPRFDGFTCNLERVSGYLTANTEVVVDYHPSLHTLMIHYWKNKIGGERMAETYEKAYSHGELYHVVSKQFKGWTANLTEVVGDLVRDTDVNVVYTEKTSTVIIHYRYLSGESAAPSVTLRNLGADEAYAITSPGVKGFTPSREIVKGTADGGNIEVTVFYVPLAGGSSGTMGESAGKTGDLAYHRHFTDLLDKDAPSHLYILSVGLGDCFE